MEKGEGEKGVSRARLTQPSATSSPDPTLILNLIPPVYNFFFFFFLRRSSNT